MIKATPKKPKKKPKNYMTYEERIALYTEIEETKKEVKEPSDVEKLLACYEEHKKNYTPELDNMTLFQYIEESEKEAYEYGQTLEEFIDYVYNDL